MTAYPIFPAALRTDRLREAMIRRGYDELTLAQALGYQTRQPIDHWLTGYHEPTIWNLRSLCRVLDIKAGFLLGLEE